MSFTQLVPAASIRTRLSTLVADLKEKQPETKVKYRFKRI